MVQTPEVTLFMNELQHSLHDMGVVQYLLAVTFLICYALVLGNFLGTDARLGVGLAGLVAAVGFSLLCDYWVHGILLTAFVVVGMGLFIGAAWLLKTLLLAWQRRRHAKLLVTSVSLPNSVDLADPAAAAHPFTDSYRLADDRAPG